MKVVYWPPFTSMSVKLRWEAALTPFTSSKMEMAATAIRDAEERVIGQ